ncbi:MAG: hypothetical protein KA765_06160 [Thermoflexales bacterium]|nr:hypothetical protein [Thermoflexales bacterium]
MNLTPIRKFTLVGLATIVVLFTSIVLVSVLKYVIFPLIDQNLQSDLLWVGGTFIILAGLFAALVQVSGYSIRDFFSFQPYTSEKQDLGQSAIRLAEETPNPEQSKNINRDRTEKLIDAIQTFLYSDDSRLPHILALGIDLCDTLGLSDEYGEWLRRELNGYPDDMNTFMKKFANEKQYADWMGKWASYRFVEMYTKFEFRASTAPCMIS